MAQPNPSVLRREPILRNPESMHIICPTCRAAVYTEVIYYPALRAHCCALTMCLCCCCCCLCIPYCLPICMDTLHVCPRCQNIIEVG